jgi:hypothetical protein
MLGAVAAFVTVQRQRLATLGLIRNALRQAGRPDLVWGIVETVPYLLGLVSAATVGAVLASRRPRHPVAGCCWPSGCL